MAEQKVSKRLAELKEKALDKAGGDIEKAAGFLQSDIESEGDTALMLEIIGLETFDEIIENFCREAIGPEFGEALDADQRKRTFSLGLVRRRRRRRPSPKSANQLARLARAFLCPSVAHASNHQTD